jgi:subtilase family serine protease
MHRYLAGGAVSAIVAFGLATGASAAPKIMQSGGVFYIAACSQAPARLHARCHADIVSDSTGAIMQSARPPVAGKTPANLRDAYKISGNGSSSTIIAIVDAFGYNNAESDLGVYRSEFGLPACTTDNGCFKKLNQDGVQGDYPPQDIGWAQESALDLDMASAMCPGCTLYLVEADDNSYQNLAHAVATAANLGAHVISNSYGGGESGTQTYETSYSHKGIAVTASTGDSGYGAGPQFPASSGHVIAVGGTRLVADSSKRGWSETVWSGAGGGCSHVYSKPAWQHDTDCSKRTEADVAAVADPATGVAVYGPNASGQGTWMVFGGTSVSAPLIGGIYGEKGDKVKYASKLYKKPSKWLYDVTSGSNGSCGGSYLCTGKPGYDGPTGNGTPKGDKAF